MQGQAFISFREGHEVAASQSAENLVQAQDHGTRWCESGLFFEFVDRQVFLPFLFPVTLSRCLTFKDTILQRVKRPPGGVIHVRVVHQVEAPSAGAFWVL